MIMFFYMPLLKSFTNYITVGLVTGDAENEIARRRETDILTRGLQARMLHLLTTNAHAL